MTRSLTLIIKVCKTIITPGNEPKPQSIRSFLKQVLSSLKKPDEILAKVQAESLKKSQGKRIYSRKKRLAFFSINGVALICQIVLGLKP